MNQRYVKPIAGRVLRHPVTKAILPPGGDWWPDNSATRRLIGVDIVEATEPGAVFPEPEPEELSPAIAIEPSARIMAMIEAGRKQLTASDEIVNDEAAPAAAKRTRKSRA